MTDPSKPTDPPTAAASAPDGAPPPRAAAAPNAAALEGDDLFEEFALPGGECLGLVCVCVDGGESGE